MSNPPGPQRERDIRRRKAADVSFFIGMGLAISLARRGTTRLTLAAIALACIAGCTQMTPPKAGTPAAARENVNLQGFPPTYRKGYADGCNSTGLRTVRDDAAFKGDFQYASGWRDGKDVCGKR